MSTLQTSSHPSAVPAPLPVGSATGSVGTSGRIRAAAADDNAGAILARQ